MNYKLFLSSIFFVMACFSLHAEESGHCGLDPQSPAVYIAENTPVYNPDLIYVKQAGPIKNCKKSAAVKKETPAPTTAENEMIEQKPMPVVLPAIPFAPSSSSFLQGGRESAAISVQQRNDKPQPVAKIYCEKTARNTNNLDLSLYHPKQRQKLSPAATQCGMLTSFASTSPPPPLPLKGERFKVKGTR